MISLYVGDYNYVLWHVIERLIKIKWVYFLSEQRYSLWELTVFKALADCQASNFNLFDPKKILTSCDLISCFIILTKRQKQDKETKKGVNSVLRRMSLF